MKLMSTLAFLAVALSSNATFADDGAAKAPAVDPALGAVIAGDWRSADNKSRDKYRHPVEVLGFWGLAPGMTVLEVQPGGGWWTEILAPYAQRTGGRFYATAVDLSNPEVPEAARKSRAEFEQRYAAHGRRLKGTTDGRRRPAEGPAGSYLPATKKKSAPPSWAAQRSGANSGASPGVWTVSRALTRW